MIEDLAERLEAAGHLDLATRLDCIAELSLARKSKQVRRDRAGRAEEEVDRIRDAIEHAEDPENRERLQDELEDREQQLDKYGPIISPADEVETVNPVADDYVGLPYHVTRGAAPTIQQTNEKAQESLPLLPKEVRSIMAWLHGLEAKRNGMAVAKPQAQQAARLWQLLKGRAGKSWGIGDVESHKEGYAYNSDAGSMVLYPPQRRTNSWKVVYTSQTKRVWE